MSDDSIDTHDGPISLHICVSVDVDRFDDKYLRSSGILDMFRDSLGCKTPRDVRQYCELARQQGFRVFSNPDCDNRKEDGSCGGHPEP